MDATTVSILVALISFFTLFLLIASGVHISVAMGLVGFLGIAYSVGINPSLGQLGTVPFVASTNFLLGAIPLFLIMGTFALNSGISTELFEAASKWLGNVKGGLGMATSVGCACFSAITGSSLACTSAMGQICLPEMERLGYDRKFAAGCVVSGGTLGIMIPPSILFIVYGWITGVSVGKMFIAGIFPGILSTFIYIVVIAVLPLFRPNIYPEPLRVPWVARFRSTKGILPMAAIFCLIISGIYFGFFTPTEAAAVGAIGTLCLGFTRKRINWTSFKDSLLQAGWTSSMVFAIIFTAMLFSYSIALTQFPQILANSIVSAGLNKWVILGSVILMYLVLGAVLESLSMIVLTMPVTYPMLVSLGFDPIWFGVVLCHVVEIGLITPPVGLNAYVLSGIAKDMPLLEIFQGIVPFLFGDFVVMFLLIIFPEIVTFLPSTMM